METTKRAKVKYLWVIRQVGSSIAGSPRQLRSGLSASRSTESRIIARPLQTVVRPLFNPTSNYSYFMLMCPVRDATAFYDEPTRYLL